MNVDIMPELTKDEIRRMTQSVIQSVAAKKIVSSKPTIDQASAASVSAAKGDTGFASCSLLTSACAPGSALSQSRGREILKTAFKKVR